MSATFDVSDIQGNILRGYRLGMVRHLILEVGDRAAARAFLGVSAAGGSNSVPAITRESSAKWAEKPTMCFNIGVTWEGLRALGTPAEHLASFPTEFVEGMAARAVKLGDVGDSAPAKWATPFDRPARVHLIASIYADDAGHLDRVQAQVARACKVLGVRDGRNLADTRVFFGYRDSISQPRFRGIVNPERATDAEPDDPLGTVLLGHPTRFEGFRFGVPTPCALGANGSFNAFRVLAQDVKGFEAYLDHAACILMSHPDGEALLPPGEEDRIGQGLDRFAALREIVAAQMCGRWRNGVPYDTSPDTSLPDPAPGDPAGRLQNFDYGRDSRCPVGSHIRRVNPRGGDIVQRIANYTRRLVRRGMSYGPDFDPARPDDRERGLLGNFIGANLGAQFEAVMYDWLNLGLQSPDITGASDPLIGANDPATSWFDLTVQRGGAIGSIRLRSLPRFVTTRGGAYAFLPSLRAITYLSTLTG